MRYLPCLLIAVLSSSALQAGSNGRNLPANPSFEQGMDGWHFWKKFPEESKGQIDVEVGRYGRASFRVENPGEGGANLYSDNVPCEPGRSYVISVYVRTQGKVKAGITAWAVAEDGETTITYGIGGTVRLPPDEYPRFTRFRHIFITPKDCRFLRAHLTCSGGTLWWDAVQIELGDQTTDYVDGPEVLTVCPEAEMFAKAIVREAYVRDLVDQADRVLRYRSGAPHVANSVRAAAKAMEQAAVALQVDHQVPKYRGLDYGKIENALAAAETAARDALAHPRRRYEPWKPKLPDQVAKDQLVRELIVFPITGFMLPESKINWRVIEPFGFRALSVGAPVGRRADGSLDFEITRQRVEEIAERGYHTVLNLGARIGVSDALTKELGEHLYFHNAQGEWSPRAHCHNVFNIWHPRFRDSFCNALRQLGTALRTCPKLLAYELVNEPSMQMAQPREGGDRYDWQPLGVGGYSVQARAAWKEWLKIEYGIIEQLNAKWGAAYAAFDGVAPPDDLTPPPPVDSRTRHPVAAHHDFCRFRAESHTRFYADLLDALHEGDPVHAVMSQFCGFAPDRKEAGLDYLDMVDRAEWDIYGTHDWPGHRPAVQCLYAASMNRYAKRPHWEDELIWSQWERKGTPERVMRAANERNLWRQIAYGKRGIILFNLANEWAHTKPHNWNNSILNVEANYEIPRYSTGIFPVIERKVHAIKDLIFDTELTHQGLAILRPTTSSYAAAPNHTTRREATALAGWLLARHWMPLFVPEECILDDREDLTQLRALIAPYATHVMAGLEERLLDWIKQGGTLICSGPFALFDEIGAPRGKLMEATLGIERLCFDSEANVWARADEANERMLERELGRGRIWLSLDCVGIAKRPEAIERPIQAAIPVHPLACTAVNKLELILRNNGRGEHFLFATNLDPRNRVDTTVLLPGRAGKVMDLCVEGGVEVPVERTELSTRIPLHLGPGKGVALGLGKLTGLRPKEEALLGGRLAADHEPARERQLAWRDTSKNRMDARKWGQLELE